MRYYGFLHIWPTGLISRVETPCPAFISRSVTKPRQGIEERLVDPFQFPFRKRPARQ